MTTQPSVAPLKLAVILGEHPFEVPPFIQLFRRMEGVDFYPQTLENFCIDMAGVRHDYDALLFYNMHGEPTSGETREVLASLGQEPQGLVFLHHGMLAFRPWDHVSGILGIADRSFSYHPGETVAVQIADTEHPITRGLEPWSMIDELYGMDTPDDDSHILLTTDHPLSLPTLAWTRQHGQSRVFVFASGHGHETYADPNFQTVLLRGIQWAAGRI